MIWSKLRIVKTKVIQYYKPAPVEAPLVYCCFPSTAVDSFPVMLGVFGSLGPSKDTLGGYRETDINACNWQLRLPQGLREG